MPAPLPPAVRKALASLHDEVMWLAARPGVTPSMARAWYTHVVADRLTSLVQAHRGLKSPNVHAFIRTLVKLENVHIVTRAENYAVMRAGGDYEAAGIKLIAWAKLPKRIRRAMWTRMLRGRVANASEFA